MAENSIIQKGGIQPLLEHKMNSPIFLETVRISRQTKRLCLSQAQHPHIFRRNP